MAEIISQTDITKTKRNIDDIDKALNTKGKVKPLWGNEFKSLPLAIQEVIETGGFEPFATEVQLLASIPVLDKKASYALDTHRVWLWDAGRWVDTGESALDQAKKYAELKASELINEFVQSAKADPLLMFEDTEGKIFALFDAFSELFLAGSEISVQEMGRLASRLTEILNKNNAESIWQIFDSEGNLCVYLDQNNELFLVGLDTSVQSALKNINVKSRHLSAPSSVASSSDLPVLEVMTTQNWLKNSKIQVCDMPKNLYPQQYYIGEEWLKTVYAPTKNATDFIQIDVWNDRGDNSRWKVDSGVVHPNVIDFGANNEMNGFRYWMGLNPYTGSTEDIELPYIFGSNNLSSWELMQNIPCPFDVDPETTADNPEILATSGHLSDSFFTYDTSTGELFFAWRNSLYFDGGRDRAKAKCSLWARSTKDGVNWSDKFEIYQEYTNITGNLLLSPAIVFNPFDNLFYLYHVTDTISGKVAVQTSSSLHKPRWSKIKIASGFDAITPYHLEAKFVGDQVVLLIHSELTDQLYFATSSDFFNFKVGGKVLQTDTDSYKGSFLPIFNEESEIGFHIFYTGDQKSEARWRLYHTQTNFNSIGV